jgi:hypothetical protein
MAEVHARVERLALAHRRADLEPHEGLGVTVHADAHLADDRASKAVVVRCSMVSSSHALSTSSSRSGERKVAQVAPEALEAAGRGELGAQHDAARGIVLVDKPREAAELEVSMMPPANPPSNASHVPR